MTTFVDPKPGRLKGVPETIVNGPPLDVTVPLLRADPPRLVTVKLACAVEPAAIVPKFILGGETKSCAGVKPAPVTVFRLLPPLLVNTTTLLKLFATPGAKLTVTTPVCPGLRVKGDPLWIEKGEDAVADP